MTGLVNAFGFVLAGTALAALVLVPRFGLGALLPAWCFGGPLLAMVSALAFVAMSRRSKP
jgi:hypothetical protein